MIYLVLVVFSAQFFVANSIAYSQEIENSEWNRFKVRNNIGIQMKLVIRCMVKINDSHRRWTLSFVYKARQFYCYCIDRYMNENKGRQNTIFSINHNTPLFCTLVQFILARLKIESLIIIGRKKRNSYADKQISLNSLLITFMFILMNEYSLFIACS